MPERSVTHGTFTIERAYPATPERVFAAFADPAKKRRWYAEGKGFAVDEFEMDFRAGGSERSRFRVGAGEHQGIECANDTTYHDIVPNRRLVLAYTMSAGGRRISASLATFEFLPAGEGTDLVFTEQGAYFEGSDGATVREAGWRQLLEALARELAQ